MAQIFNSFISGMDAGTQQREQRSRRDALEEAGRLYAANDAQGAENALIGAGLINEAGQYSALNESRRGRATRQAASDAVAQLGPNATPEASMQAAAGAYFRDGDFEQGGRIYNTYAQMNEHQRAQVGQNLQFISQQFPELRAMPVEQRAAAALARIEGTPFDTPQLRAEIERRDGGDGITDADIDNWEQSMLTYQDRLGIQREDAAIARQERQFQQQLAIQRQNAFGRRNLSTSEVRQFGNDYERGMRAINDSLGPQIMNAMPWANQVAASGAVPEGTSRDLALINDQGMLRAMARLQTGVGVLTEGEVRDTIGNDLYQRMNQAGAAFRLNERLPEGTRQALAQLVQQGVNRASQQAWDYRQNSLDEYASVTNGGAPTGWAMPSVPHPQDMASLRATEQSAGAYGLQELRPNSVHIAPSGRAYVYMGPGNWLPQGEGRLDEYQARRNERVSRGGAPEVPVNAPQQRRAQANAPAVGTIVNGFRFRGGDPNDRNNWEDTRQLRDIGAGNR